LDAQAALGVYHLRGEEGLEQDAVKAAVLFRFCAERGHLNAQTALYLCYHEGTGVEKNYTLAALWLRRAADQGNARAQFGVGRMYASGGEGEGEGVKKNLPLAMTYLELSAAQGEQEAIALLQQLR